MTEEEAMLVTIRANPDDDLPRLVYADWLQERGGEERAVYIRVQCELAKMPATIVPGDRCPKCNGAGHWRRGVGFEHEKRCPKCELVWEPGGAPIENPEAEKLRRREQKLRSRHGKAWSATPGFTPYAQTVVFQRGFPERWIMDAESWLRHGDAIHRYHPVREVELTTWPDGEVTRMRASRQWKARVELGRTLEEIFADEWPGVTFTMPPPTRIERSILARAGLVMRFPGWPPERIEDGWDVPLTEASAAPTTTSPPPDARAE